MSKPTNKIINMHHFIKSGIDCEFSDPEVDTLHIGKLTRIHINNYHKDDGLYWRQCRPRMNHKMLHDGGDCPLPEGFRVKLLTICGGRLQHSTGLSSVTKAGNVWKDADYYPVIGYEILGLADGYAYKLESDE